MTTPVIIDIIAVIILAGSAIYGAKRGLFRTLAGLLIILVALGGAHFAAETLTAPAVKLLEPAVQRHIERRLDDALTAPEAPGKMPEASLEDSPVGELLALLGLEGRRGASLREQAEEAVRDTGVSILTAVAESVAESFLYGGLYILTFLLLLLLLNLLARMLDLIFKLPVLHGANALGGAVVGLLEGVLVLLLLSLALRWFGIPVELGLPA